MKYRHEHEATAVRVVLAVLLFSLLILHGCYCFATEEEAQLKISEADKALLRAFDEVMEAEKSGANVSVLVSDLNEAGSFLAEANMASSTGNSDKAITMAQQCITLAGNVENEASTLKKSTVAMITPHFVQAVAVSALLALLFLGVFFAAWSWFESYYRKRLLDSKPEVISDVEA